MAVSTELTNQPDHRPLHTYAAQHRTVKPYYKYLSNAVSL